MLKLSILLKIKLMRLFEVEKMTLFFYFCISTLVTWLFYYYDTADKLISQKILIRVAVYKISILYAKSEFFFFMFTFFYSIFFWFIVYLLYLYKCKKLICEYNRFVSFLKKRKDKFGFFFLKNGYFILHLWSFFLIIVSVISYHLLRDVFACRFVNFTIGYLFALLVAKIFNKITNNVYKSFVLDNRRDIEARWKLRRQNLISIFFFFCYTLINSVYTKVRNWVFHNKSSKLFIDFYLHSFEKIFGNYGFMVIYVLFLLTIFLLSFLYFFLVFLISNIIVSRVSTVYLGDFLYKKYDKFWMGGQFKELYKKNFEFMFESEKTLFQRLFDPFKLHKISTSLFNRFAECTDTPQLNFLFCAGPIILFIVTWLFLL